MTDKAEGAELVELRAEVERLQHLLREAKRLYDETIAGRVLAHRALKNVLFYTVQQRRELRAEIHDNLLRFCAEGGVKPSILRDSGIDTTVAE